MSKLKVFLISAVLVLINASTTLAQCAMCRATLETNVSNGAEENMAATLNVGIMYLFAAPYILVATIGYFWYKQSRPSSISKK